ncbi:hypothetical protein BCY89_26855 [Sphingobacterium siyangense]|uniref:Uncharacterized protein n=1 Tax=Sphingobacterium siyangense TaxID=459529 RepID=A0A420G0G8_9SPHI|nr:hypothetical protein [Sphingobacterium siyangense]RKF38686.1 hypothetical protein BCY89_26855 [Sphingobacterium siyangense]
MTLKELAESFPDIYKQYSDHCSSRRMTLKPIDRLISFIESRYNISIINIVQEKNQNFKPCIRINGNETKYDISLPLSRSKSFLVTKAIEAINMGLAN